MRADTVLRLAPGLVVEVDGLVIRLGGEPIFGGPRALAVLAAFERPRSLDEALRSLTISGHPDFADLTTTILRLRGLGVLIDAELGPLPTWGFASPEQHVSMLDDEARTRAWLDAVAEVVRPGDVVVDLGTGTGVLALAAARAGAARVYAIESTGIARAARALFERNETGEVITLLTGRSTQLDLPERADVLVAELVGDDPLSEGILEYTADARRRWLVPGARLVPHRLSLRAHVVELPSDRLCSWTFAPENTARWTERYGFDFSPLSGFTPDGVDPLAVRPQEAASFRLLAEAFLLDVDLGAFERTDIDTTVETVALDAGTAHAVVVSFDAHLGRSVYTTDPSRASMPTHWRCAVWLLAEPLAIGAGSRVALRCRYGGWRTHVEVTGVGE